MRYTIEGFNQEILIQNNISLKETYILRYIVTINSLENSIKKEFDGEMYCWIKYQSLLDEYPILDIPTTKKLGVALKEMQKKGILKLKLDMNPLGTFTYIKFDTSLFLNLTTKNPDNYLPTAENDKRGARKRAGGVHENVQGGCTKMGTHNILLLNNNPITKNNPIISNADFDEKEIKEQVNKNILANWRIILEELQEQDKDARFTNREWEAIEMYALSDKHRKKSPDLIKGDLIRLIDNAFKGFDIRDALIQSMNYSSLSTPKVHKMQDEKGKYLTLEQIQKIRFDTLDKQLADNNFYNRKL